MASVGLIGATAIGAVVALAGPILVWALVVTGLREVRSDKARSRRRQMMQPDKLDA